MYFARLLETIRYKPATKTQTSNINYEHNNKTVGNKISVVLMYLCLIFNMNDFLCVGGNKHD